MLSGLTHGRPLAALLVALGAVTLGAGMGGCRQSGANRSAVIRCTPGERVDVSCGCLSLGTECTGRAGIRLCDAALANGACEPAHAVTSTDDRQRCSNGDPPCPLATTFCPQSGLLAIATFASPDYNDETGAYTCQWAVRRSAIYSAPRVTFACMPGEMVRASCGCDGLGRACEGDPVMRACAPGATCGASEPVLDYNDDTCGRCPSVEAFCPAAGSILIATEALGGSSSRYRCELGAVGADGRALSPSGV